MGLKKYVFSGNIIEVFEYSQYNCGKGGANRTKAQSEDLKQKAINYANTNQRRRDTVRRLACCNFDTNNARFFTLTFSENKQNVVECNYIFQNFIKRLNYKFNTKIKYLAVIEFQDKNGRGAVHYHVLSDIPYIPQEELQKIWGQGFVYINKVKHVDNIGAYIVKYMTKDSCDERLQGLQAYLHSRNLIKSTEIVNHDLKEFAILEEKIEKKYNLSKKEACYEALYDTEHLGSCNYKQYNLKRG